MDKLIKILAALGWVIAPPSLSRSLGSALKALAHTDIPGATWRLRIGKRITALERRAHGTPTGRASVGHWERIATVDTPRDAAGWREAAAGLTSEALAHESAARDILASRGRDRSTRRYDATGGEAGGTLAGRGRVGKSNPSRLAGFGFAPASGFRLLPHTREGGRARKRRQNFRRKAQRAAKLGVKLV